MPDISMCLGIDCPDKYDCYRFMAIASEMQSYSTFEYNKKTQICKKFYPIGDKVDIKEIKDE